MIKHYYKIVAIFGLFCALGLSFFLLGSYVKTLFSLHDKFHSLMPIISGMATTLIVAVMLDIKKNKSHQDITFWKGALVYPLIIYLSGVAVGSIFNCALNAQSFVEISDYLKATFALIVFGVPSALIVGVLVYAVHKGYF
jgi:hypothetical protein